MKPPVRNNKALKLKKDDLKNDGGTKIQNGFKLPSMKPVINFKNSKNAKYFQSQNPQLATILKKIGVISAT